MRWIVVGDELHLLLPDNSTLLPSAEEIWEVAFEGQGQLRSQAVDDPRAQLGCLSFSRFPVDFQLTMVTSEAVPLSCSITASVQGQPLQVTRPLTRNSDHVIVEGTWYPFGRGALDEVRSALGEAKIDTLGPISLGQYLALERQARTKPFILDLTHHAVERLKTEGSAEQHPGGFVGHLYPYQLNGLRWLRMVSGEGLGCILADQMGLGKTPQLIALMAAERATRPGRTSLVVAPATLLENWNRELRRFAPSLRVRLHRGPGRTGLPINLTEADIVVTSYETAVRDLPLLRMVPWNLVVLDEAQAVKTPSTRRAQSVKRIPRRVGIAVTGTPLENRLTDLWSLLDFAVPGHLGSLSAFERSYVAESKSSGASVEPLISPLMLRRRLADVAVELPERIDIPQPLELTEEGAEDYERLRQQILAEYGAAATLVSLTKLREYCSHPSIIRKDTVADYADNSPKYRRLLEILDEVFANDEKALVFTSFVPMIDIIVKDLPRRLNAYVDWIDGRVPGRERQDKVDGFAETKGCGVLVLNPRTGGTGLNITAANHVIHYNLDWNPAVEDQASARVHRLGQERPVTVHRLYYVDTVEEVIDDRLARKRALAEVAVVGNTGVDSDREDILKALQTSPWTGGPDA